MATATDDVEVIRRQMAQIRRELHEDVREVVATAEAVTDWHRYIRSYPWAALGAAFTLGFVIVPRKRRSVPRDVARQADLERVVEAVAPALSAQATPKQKEQVKEAKSGLFGAAFGFLAPIAVRAAQGYAVRFLEQWVQQQQMQAMAAGPQAPPSAGSHPPPPTGMGWPPGGKGWPGGMGGPAKPA